VPRAPWRRRRTIDSPRPAGRRWAGRLRRGGSFARQVLVGRAGDHQADASVPRIDSASGALAPDALLPRRRFLRRRTGGRLDLVEPGVVEPGLVEPRLVGSGLVEPGLVLPAAALAPTALSIPLLPGERTFGRRLRFAAVNGCTIASMVLGVSAIFLAMGGADLRLAALCLIACVVFDGLDGALARRLGVASPFGAQMDSLADMCSFGIAAPVVVYAWLAGSAPGLLVVPACALVAVCAAIRLARFNVSPKDGRFFCGVPTTLVAAVLALATLIAPEVPVGFQVAAVALLALAMVSSFPYLKLARILRLPPWLLVLPVVGAFIDYQMTFIVVVLAYLASGPLVWLRTRT
jgi:CDP-diacylglycerol---serine O-phosphatidyltransferase